MMLPTLRKSLDGKDCSRKNVFSATDKPEFLLQIPRALELVSPKLRLTPDGGETIEFSPEYDGFDGESDRFRLRLDLSALCGEAECGLFFYDIRFEQNYRSIFTTTSNNVDFSLSAREGRPFALLVHKPDFTTPRAYYGTTMYHIFVDRFAKGKEKTPVRADAVLDPDWEHGIPDFAPYAGAPLANNNFFGGSLWGVIDKLDYLESLSVGTIYLSPIFKAYSNHKYDTGDYETVDEMFGGREALDKLLAECKKRGIKVILDGVFNHTGDNSKYFNRYGNYDTVGAYQDEKSPYHDWYIFNRFPNQYEAWWGIEILPKLNTRANRACREYFTGKDGICASYVKAGTNGWRLDVADELSDAFLDELRATVKSVDPEALIVGEVWENAAEKISYGYRRRYFQGDQLDSVMNYPVKNAIIEFVRHGNCTALYDTVTEIYSIYPRVVCNCLMNILGTHDTERILTVLGGRPAEGLSNWELSTARMTEEERAYGKKMLKIASALQYTLYGFPSVFYGDEVGSEGYHDPFCRMPFPWGREDEELLKHYRALGKLRAEHSAFAGGEFAVTAHDEGLFAFVRWDDKERIEIITNRASFPIRKSVGGEWVDLLTGKAGEGDVETPPDGFRIVKVK